VYSTILRIPYTAHVSSPIVCNQQQDTSSILDRRLNLFGHICQADPSHNHVWALQASINHLLEEWRCQRGCCCQSWLQTIEGDLNSQNIDQPQPGISHLAVPTGIMFSEQLYSGRSEPLDDDDDQGVITGPSAKGHRLIRRYPTPSDAQIRWASTTYHSLQACQVGIPWYCGLGTYNPTVIISFYQLNLLVSPPENGAKNAETAQTCEKNCTKLCESCG